MQLQHTGSPKIDYLSMSGLEEMAHTESMVGHMYLWWLQHHPSAVASPLNISVGVFVPVGKEEFFFYIENAMAKRQ